MDTEDQQTGREDNKNILTKAQRKKKGGNADKSIITQFFYN